MATAAADVIAWRGLWDGAEHITVHPGEGDAGTTVSGGGAADALIGDARSETLRRAWPATTCWRSGAGDDTTPERPATAPEAS
ncbi:hypothetical protein ACRAWD_29825 [Caulobacter segnis]